jgi:hypothetical protein
MNREEILKIAKPILFNTEMVREILDGRKTVTRRVAKHSFDNLYKSACYYGKWNETYGKTPPEYLVEWYIKIAARPKYAVGDILYVRETWAKAKNGYFYKEVWEKDDIADITKWKPSIHMPKEAARILLRIADVRVERLQDITEEQAKAEGICVITNNSGYMHRSKFASLWNSTVPKKDLDRYGWKANPWVWVYEFEKLDEGE